MICCFWCLVLKPVIEIWCLRFLKLVTEMWCLCFFQLFAFDWFQSKFWMWLLGAMYSQDKQPAAIVVQAQSRSKLKTPRIEQSRAGFFYSFELGKVPVDMLPAVGQSQACSFLSSRSWLFLFLPDAAFSDSQNSSWLYFWRLCCFASLSTARDNWLTLVLRKNYHSLSLLESSSREPQLDNIFSLIVDVKDVDLKKVKDKTSLFMENTIMHTMI